MIILLSLFFIANHEGIPPNELICRQFVQALRQKVEVRNEKNPATNGIRESFFEQEEVLGQSLEVNTGLLNSDFWSHVFASHEFMGSNLDRRQIHFQSLNELTEELKTRIAKTRDSPHGPIPIRWTMVQTQLAVLAAQIAEFLPPERSEDFEPYFQALAYLIGDPRVHQTSLTTWLFGLSSSKLNAPPDQIIEELSALTAAVSLIQNIREPHQLAFSSEFALLRDRQAGPSFDLQIIHSATGEVRILYEVKTLKSYRRPTDLKGPIEQTTRKIRKIEEKASMNEEPFIQILRFGQFFARPEAPINLNLSQALNSPEVGKGLIIMTPWSKEVTETRDAQLQRLFYPDGRREQFAYNDENEVVHHSSSDLFELSVDYLNEHARGDRLNAISITQPNGQAIVHFRRPHSTQIWELRRIN